MTGGCCAKEFVKDRDGGAVDTIRFTIGHCGQCDRKLVHVRTPYGPDEGTVHELTGEKHAQLLDGTDVDFQIFREKWLRR